MDADETFRRRSINRLAACARRGILGVMRYDAICRVLAVGFFASPGAIAAVPPPLVPVAAAEKRDAAALAQLTREAEAGGADAQLELGLAFDDGSAGAIERAKAAEWYARAAQSGIAVAHLRLGMLLEDGSAGRQSYAEARDHYLQAIAGGVPEANLRLGILHLEGWGVPREPALAVAAIEKAAVAGYQPAQLVLSDMYAVGISAKRDPARALEWAQKVAAQKSAEGEMRMGNIALRRGLPQKDFQLAREWYQLSAEKEYTQGMMAIAATFFRTGQAADREMGVRWLRLAADSGSSAAAFYLGGYIAVTAEHETAAEARQWFQLASERGEAAATEVLDLVSKGRSLRDAFGYVMTVPFMDRYVKRYDKAHLNATLDPNGTHQPMPLKLVEPVYPVPLRLTNTEGDVTVEFVVDTTGRVRDARAIKSAHPAFSERAVEAVRRWVFSPGQRKGVVVTTRMRVPVYFRLSQVRDGGAKPPAGSGELEPVVPSPGGVR